MEINDSSDSNQLDLFTDELSEESFTGLDWLMEPAVLTLFGRTKDGSTIPMLRVLSDMTIEYGPDYTPDEAASVFWDALVLEGQSLTSRLIEAVDLVENYMERAERSSSCYIIADAERDALRRENEQLRLRLKAAGLK